MPVVICRQLLLGLFALLVCAAPASATLHSAWDLHEGSLEASVADGGVAARPSLGTEIAGRLTVPTGTLHTVGAWSVVLAITPVTGEEEILTLGSGSRLALEAGKLTWIDAKGNESAAATALPLGAPAQIVVTHSVEAVTVRGGGTTLELTDGAADLAGLTVIDSVHRIRLFDQVLSPAEVGALRVRDDEAPSGITIDESPKTYRDPDGTLWAGPRGTFLLKAVDDGTGPLDTTLGVLSGGSLLPPAGKVTSSASAVLNEAVVTSVAVPFDLRALMHGVEYQVAGAVSDRAGQRTEFSLPIRTDLEGPKGLTVAGADRTTERLPKLSGTAAIGARDSDAVSIAVCRGTTCDADPADEIASAGARIENGRWGPAELYTWVEGDPTPRKVLALPLGTYTVRVTHEDFLGNAAVVERRLSIVSPPRQVDDAGSPSAPVPPGDALIVAPPRPAAPLTPSALLARTRSSVVAALLREGLRGLARDGRGVVDVAVDQPAEVVVQLFDGGAPKRVDVKARPAAARRLIAVGRATFSRAGSRKIAVRLSKRARSLLRSGRLRKVSVRTIVVPRGGRAVADTRTITLRR